MTSEAAQAVGAMAPRELKDAVEAAKSAFGEDVLEGAPLGSRTTYRVGGKAALSVVVGDERDLERLARAVGASGLPVLVVGKGSNLLVADGGFAGIAVFLGEGFSTVSLPTQDTALEVSAGGAAALPVVARQSAAAGWHGLEWAVGIPGSVGGAVKMNAGGHGSDTSAHLIAAEVVDLARAKVETWPLERLEFGLRHSALGPNHLVLGARFEVEAASAALAVREVEDIVRWRREHQPGGRNAGSVFKNPPGDHAGRLIEAAGCKGMRLASAEVSPKHANFIISDREGKADDVVELMLAVADRVEQTSGVRLRPEVHLVGFSHHILSSLYGLDGTETR